MSKKLLLADDSLTIQKVVGIVFANLDYQLLIADNGEAALELALKELPDLVIADVGMPGMDGFELCRRLKTEANLGGVPLLLLPGAFEHFDQATAESVGADGWLTKPFESQALIDKVEELLAAAPAQPVAAAPPEPTPAEEESAEVAPVEFGVPEPEMVFDEVPDAELSEAEEADDFVSATEPVEFDEPTALEDTAAGDDIWDSVTFEEEDLKSAAEEPMAEVGSEGMIQFEEPEPLEEEEAPVASVPAETELGVSIEEESTVESEEFAVEEETPAFEIESEESGFEIEEAEPEEEVLELGEEDILELEDDAIVEEPDEEEPVAAEPLSFEEEPAEEEPVAVEAEDEADFFTEEPEEEVSAAAPVDFSAPSFTIEPEPEVESAPEPAVAAESDFVFSDPDADADLAGEASRVSGGGAAAIDEPESYDLDAVSTEEPASATASDAAQAEAQLRQLDSSAMEAVIRKVAGPMIEKLAAELLEQVVWEVVPDLAESMIKDEIRKIKEGAA